MYQLELKSVNLAEVEPCFECSCGAYIVTSLLCCPFGFHRGMPCFGEWECLPAGDLLAHG